MKPHWSAVAIVGVGLIGGSAGQALLRRRLAGRVIGIGRDPASLAEAQRRGAVTDSTTDLAAVGEADFVLVATAVGSIGPLLERIDGIVRPGTPLTDAGSTKARIVAGWERHRARRRGRFVGGHPLAGSHLRGPAAADAELFTGRVAVVTPARATPAEDVETVAGFWAALGATAYVMAPREHDRMLAASSHAPHALAAALAAATPAPARRFTAGGWRDTTRVAAGDPALWADILLDNAAEVTRALSRVTRTAARLQRALERGDRRTVEAFLSRAKEARDAVGS